MHTPWPIVHSGQYSHNLSNSKFNTSQGSKQWEYTYILIGPSAEQESLKWISKLKNVNV